MTSGKLSLENRERKTDPNNKYFGDGAWHLIARKQKKRNEETKKGEAENHGK